MTIASKIKNFKRQDIRNKLKTLSRKLKIKIYPDFFYSNGLRSIYSKVIFNLIFNEKLRQVKKKIIIIFLKEKKIEKK